MGRPSIGSPSFQYWYMRIRSRSQDPSRVLIAHVIDTRAFRGIVTVEFALRPGAPSAEPELSTCERHDDAETRPIGMWHIRDDTTFVEWE